MIPRNLGVVTGPDGMVRLFPGLVRGPDVAYASWDRFPGRKLPEEPIPDLAPDLVIEVLSKSNTRARDEAQARRILRRWCAAGLGGRSQASQQVSVYTPDGTVTVLMASQRLEGGDILPGFTLELSELFSELDRHG